MAGGTSYYDIEDLYQAFKERLINELKVRSDELLKDSLPDDGHKYLLRELVKRHQRLQIRWEEEDYEIVSKCLKHLNT